MAYLAVDRLGEAVYSDKPIRDNKHKLFIGMSTSLPKGSVERLIGNKMKFEDEPYNFHKLPERFKEVEMNDCINCLFYSKGFSHQKCNKCDNGSNFKQDGISTK